MKLSIVITHLNRERQLIETLYSIRMYDNVEIIVVDDNSSDLSHLQGQFKFKLINIRDGYPDTVKAHNIGFSHVTGDVVLINCAECMHVGNITDYVFKNYEKGKYMNFATYSDDGNFSIQNQPAKSDGESGWYVHSKYAYSLLPFCAAIGFEDLKELGGFDERFGEGIGYADNDFIERLLNLNLTTEVIDWPFCIHQKHQLTKYDEGFKRNEDLINKLRQDNPSRIYAPENKYFR